MKVDAGTSVPLAGRYVGLSGTQRSLWFHYLKDPELQGFFNISFVTRIEPRIDAPRLQRVLSALTRRHTMFRVSFATVDGEVVQQAHAEASIPLQVIDMSEDVVAIERRISIERHRPFDTAIAPLVRATLYQAGQSFSVLVFTMDHLICDGWSGWQVTEQIVSMLGGDFASIHSQPLQPGPEFRRSPANHGDFFDYVLQQQQWLAGTQARRQLEYWKQELAHLTEPLELNYQRNAPERRAVAVVKLDEELVRGLHALAIQHGVSLYVVLLASYLMLLRRLTGNAQLSVGAPMPGRSKEWYECFGVFNNTVVLRAELSAGMRVAELVAQLRGTLFRALKNQLYPFAELARHLRTQSDQPDRSFFQVWFNHQNSRIDSELANLGTPVDVDAHVRCGELVLRPFGEWRGSGGPGVDLLLETIEIGTQIRADLDYNAGRFDHATIERYLSYWQRLLAAMVSNDAEQIDRLPMLSDAERRQLLYLWNAPTGTASQPQCIHECIHALFEQQVARTPLLVALEEGERRLSYAELNARANQLARRLRELGVGPEQRVALSMERSIEMVVGVLAILKAGGTYVPLEPSYPALRLSYILQDAAPCLLLTQRALRNLLPASSVPVFEVDADWEGAAALDTSNLSCDPRLTSTQLACITYTSGSTGHPKGVMADHARTLNRVLDQAAIAPLQVGEKCAQKTAIGFVDAIFETLHPLLAGATLVIIPNAITAQVRQLAATLAAHRVTRWITVPSLASALLLDEQCVQQLQGLRYWLLSGEALPADLLRELRCQFPHCCFINIYGASEAADATYYVGGMLQDESRVPIGRPLPNAQIYILDGQGAPVPVGVPGEIHVGGAAVACGYLNLPELTAQRFLQDPFSSQPGARMYRTGDVGRWRSDGHIDYLGRNDHQVKIRGFRIELPEIEARLRGLEGVSDTVVVLSTRAPGEARLVAYYVGTELSPQALRTHLSQSLPEYMVPAAYVRLPALPLTPNGKLDRAALPLPGADAYSQATYAAPEGAVEELLARLWRDLLQVEQVGRHDHFFRLGGHSLLAVKLIDQLQQHGLQLQVRSLFAHPTLAALATEVVESGHVAVPDNLIPAGTTTITPQMLPLIDLSQDQIDNLVAAVDGGVTNVQDIYPLTGPQEGILFHYLLEQRGDAYVLPSLLRFDSRAGLDEFVTALAGAVARHDNLRTSFHWEGLTQPVQVVWRHAELRISCFDLDTSAASAIEQLRARFGSGSCRLDVRRAPLMQLYIAPDAHQAGWLLMVVSHHLIQDNTSLQALLEEMQLQRRGVQLPAAVPYRNFVAHLRLGTQAASHDAFFHEMLAGVEEPTLPFGLDALGGVRELQRARTMLAVSLSKNLRRQGSALGVSVASLCHLAWARLIACAAGLEQAVFGTVLSGRMQAGAGAARAGGVFTNTLPICLAADGGTVRMRVLETHRRLAQLLQHENASLAAVQRCSSLPSATPLFSALLNYRHGIVDGRGDLGWPGAELIDSEEGSHYPLRLSIDALEGSFMLTAHAPAQVGAQRVCDLMTTVLQGLVTALAEAPDTPVNRLPVLTALEQQQVLYGWNTTGSRPAVALCVHQLFEQQVARTPLLVALEEGEQRLSYADLNARANQLARYLRGLGVGPEQRVALSMERSIAMVVGVLAILKAGGTYVPLEPSYPAVRLNYILQDAAPCLLLTQSALRESLPAGNVPVFEVDAGWESVAALDSSNLPSDPWLTSAQLACVTYTSGSTGHPKGVVADHARTVNRVLDQVAIAPLSVGEKCAQKTAIGFVDAIFETLHPLLAGATLVIIANSISTQVRLLAATLAAHRVTRWITVPSLASALLLDEQCVQQLQGLRYWLLSGEALPADLLGELRRQLPHCCFINIYGASEAADATYYVGGTSPDESRVPIGRPLPNTQIYILDAQGAPVPVGVPGEIYVGGASVARGYLNQPALTAQRFLQDPFSLEPTSIEPTSIESGARMYRTGDVGRWRSDGQIEYLGRNDHQVKIRGFRIELGEIETCLRAHAQLSDVAVLARAVTAQDKQLVAYYISANDIDAETLRSYAAATLPHFMVPAAYVRLASFPLSPNGKLDRRALPAPQGNAYARGAAYDAPCGEIETRLAQLWMELLKVDRVGRRDNFFELGGHSLLAVSLSQLIAVRLQVEVSIAEVFEHPELALLAAWVTEAMLEQFDADDLLELVEL